MKIAFITNIRAPYRTLQLNEFATIKDIELVAYYTWNKEEKRMWSTNSSNNYKEVDLSGYISKELFKIVKNNEVIILGGYNLPNYIVASIVCKILRKPYILCYDGISTNRLLENENKFKKILKKLVISNANYIMGNGKVSKEYFNKIFKYPNEKIYNQYLTVDSKKIDEIYKNKRQYTKEYREKLNIPEDKKVVIYSGRVIKIKNIEIIIEAIPKVKREDIVVLIIGGGELEFKLKKKAEELGVEIFITGFIKEQEELFKHYCTGDLLILPSNIYEVWGLVVNEAMFAGLPIIASEICGCTFDLVKEGYNGYTFNPFNSDELAVKIGKVLENNKDNSMGNNSRKLIEPWTFENSAKTLDRILKNYV